MKVPVRGSVKVKIKYPVTDMDGVEFAELTIRRPMVRDLKKTDAIEGEIEKMSKLITALSTNGEDSQFSPFGVDLLDVEDFAAVSEVINSFFESPPQTGEK